MLFFFSCGLSVCNLFVFDLIIFSLNFIDVDQLYNTGVGVCQANFSDVEIWDWMRFSYFRIKNQVIKNNN